MTFSLSSEKPEVRKGERIYEIFSQKEMFIYRTLQFKMPTNKFKTSVFNPKNYLWDPQKHGRDFLQKIEQQLPDLEEEIAEDLAQFLESLCAQLQDSCLDGLRERLGMYLVGEGDDIFEFDR